MKKAITVTWNVRMKSVMSIATKMKSAMEVVTKRNLRSRQQLSGNKLK